MTPDTAPHLDDEALSAALDGDVGDGDAAAHLAACAACSRRRDRLAAARHALSAVPVEPLDDLTRRRLVAGALAAAPGAAGAPDRVRRFRPLLAGGVAAAVLALLAAVPLLGDGGSADSAAGGEALAGARFLGDLGDVSDPEALRLRLGAGAEVPMAAESEAAGDPATTGAAREGTGVPVPGADPAPAAPVPDRMRGPGGAPPPDAGAGEAADTGVALRAGDDDVTAGATDRAATDRCATALAAGPARGSRLVAIGVATYRGAPAVVAVFSEEGRPTGYVAAREDCRVLRRLQL